MAEEKKTVALRNNIGDQVIGRLNELAPSLISISLKIITM